MSTDNSRVSKPQIRNLLLARGHQASRVRGGLITLLAQHTEIQNLAELPTGELVGHMIGIESAELPLGAIVQSIIAQAPIEEPEAHKAARLIMGSNFLGMTEVAKVFGALSVEAQAALAVIPFSEATLRARCDTHVLVADIGISIIDVRGRMKRGLFRSYEDAWYNAQKFAKRTDQVCWRLIRKTPVQNSTSKSWDNQLKLIGAEDEVPTARAMVYAIMLVFATTGERLFEGVYVRTSDVDSGGHRVGVGGFGERGLYVGSWGGGSPDDDVSVSSSRKAA